jgi:hypothetical protein
MQLVLFVALLLVGVILVLRACGGGSPSTEPGPGPIGQADLTPIASFPHLPHPPCLRYPPHL